MVLSLFILYLFIKGKVIKIIRGFIFIGTPEGGQSSGGGSLQRNRHSGNGDH